MENVGRNLDALKKSKTSEKQSETYFILHFLKSLSDCIDRLVSIAERFSVEPGLVTRSMEGGLPNILLKQADFLRDIFNEVSGSVGLSDDDISKGTVVTETDLAQSLYETSLTLTSLTEKFHYQAIHGNEGKEKALQRLATGITVGSIAEQKQYLTSHRLALACQSIYLDSVLPMKIYYDGKRRSAGAIRRRLN